MLHSSDHDQKGTVIEYGHKGHKKHLVHKPEKNQSMVWSSIIYVTVQMAPNKVNSNDRTLFNLVDDQKWRAVFTQRDVSLSSADCLIWTL